MKSTACVKVRSTNKVFAPVGEERLVSRQEAAALATMGNAELVDGNAAAGTYSRRDMVAEPPHGPARKTR